MFLGHAPKGLVMNNGANLAADASRGPALLGADIRWVCGASRALAAGRLDTQVGTFIYDQALTVRSRRLPG